MVACCTLLTGLGTTASCQAGKEGESVRSILPPVHPLPSENESRGVSQFSFIVYGDTRGRYDGKALQHEHSLVVDQMLKAIKRMDTTRFPVRFILQTGDAVVNGGDANQWNMSFIGLINRVTQEGGVPYFLAPGNHDVTKAEELSSPDRQRGLRNYLAAIAQLIPPDGAPRRLSGYPTYAFGYGNAFFIAFDSNIASDEVQFAWVKTQLETLDRTRYPLVIVFCHHPAFSSAHHGGPNVEPPTAEIRKRYMPLFRKHHVRIFFTGHEHVFEHWVERYRDASGTDFRLDHIVTGGGGAPPYQFTGTPDVTGYLAANAAEHVTLEHLVTPGPKPGDNPYHFLLVTVNGESIDMEVIGVDWGRDFRPYENKHTGLQDEPAR